MIKILKWVPIIFLIVIITVALLGRWYLTASLPEREGALAISGIENNISILFDAKGIPQVYAETDRDAWFAVGWLHAGDRLFQMEMTRRVSAGRLSEMFGEVTVDLDILQHKIGHRRMAAACEDNLTPAVRERLQAYVDGINAWAGDTGALPFEFALLGLEYEPWTVRDCLMIGSFQSWFSDALQNNDEFFLFLADSVGLDQAKELLQPYPEWAPKTVPQRNSDLAWRSEAGYRLLAEGFLPNKMSQASNSWAIAPQKSASGSAMLASDPHLDVTRLPQFWYYIGIHSKESGLNVLGITAPGVPLVVMGHNGHAAWAFTAGGVDVTDYYIEQVSESDSMSYRTPDGWERFTEIRESVKVNGREDEIPVRVLNSRHGPVVGRNNELRQLYAWRWAGQDKDLAEMFEAGLKLPYVQTFDNFRNTVMKFGALDANWMYADRDGNIGYQLGTPIPVRKTGQSSFRLDGADRENDWNGYRQPDETPHALNPVRGWLATCNNKPDEAGLDYPLLGNFASDRILRISELLSTTPEIGVEDMIRFQMDQKSEYILHWRDIVATTLDDIGEKDLAQGVRNWNGNAGPDSHEMAIVMTWLFDFRQNAFGDELGDQTSWISFTMMEKLYSDNSSHWFDNPATEDVVETAQDVAVQTMKDVLAKVGDKPWSQLNSLTMSHPLAVVPALNSLLELERGPFPRGGTRETLNVSFIMPNDSSGFKTVLAPSWRFVIDFANVDDATVVLPAGQSGNPLDEHFFDFYSDWSVGERWNIPFSKEKVVERAVSELQLQVK